MKLSTKARYAVMAMFDLSVHDRGPLALADIAEAQGISLSYLEQIFALLREKKLVEGVRGPGGGYRLGRPAKEITLAEVISAVEESLGREEGEQSDILSRKLWSAFSGDLYSYLNSITLADFLDDGAHQDIIKSHQANWGKYQYNASAA